GCLLRENGLQEKRATKATLSSLLLCSDERLSGPGLTPAGGISLRSGLSGAAAKPPRLQVGIASDADARAQVRFLPGGTFIALFRQPGRHIESPGCDTDCLA